MLFGDPVYFSRLSKENKVRRERDLFKEEEEEEEGRYSGKGGKGIFSAYFRRLVKREGGGGNG